MSRHALEFLLDADCSPVEKVILQILARHGRGTNGSGGFPSVRRIANMARISPTTALVVLKFMRTKGWVTWPEQERKLNVYTLHLNTIPILPNLWRSSNQDWTVPEFDTAVYQKPIQPCIENWYRSAPVAVSESDTNLYQSAAKSVPETGTEASTKQEQKQKHAPVSECESIYQAYPKHKDKQAALLEIARALKKISYAELLTKVERFAQKVKTENIEMQYIKYPARWFKAGSYDDEDLKPPPKYDVVEISPEEWWGKETHGTKN